MDWTEVAGFVTGAVRGWMHRRFREVLAGQAAPWVEVHGSRHERLDAAAAAVDALMTRGWRLADPLG